MDKITLLYVDDEPMNLMVFEINFKNKFKVITAESGVEGLDKLSANSEITLTISDMRMPGMNGIEFIQEAKKRFPNISFFILTGFDITKEIADALQSGLIHKYFRKPFNMNEIEAAINDVLK